jgi:anti-anti-sigma regulatory factor
VNAIVGDDEMLLVLRGDLGTEAAGAVHAIRSWLITQHGTEVFVDAAAASATAPEVVDELVQLAQLVRIGGGTAALVAESPAFIRARRACRVTGSIDRSQRAASAPSAETAPADRRATTNRQRNSTPVVGLRRIARTLNVRSWLFAADQTTTTGRASEAR